MSKKNITYRQATVEDLQELTELAIKSWTPFQTKLTEVNRASLYKIICNKNTYDELLKKSTCLVSISGKGKIIGMAFLVPNGNPDDIFLKEWSYMRFVSVDPDFGGLGIGRKLITMCIDLAKQNGETMIALHTSEIMQRAKYIYSSLGFEVIKEIDQRLGKRYWLYGLDLTK